MFILVTSLLSRTIRGRPRPLGSEFIATAFSLTGAIAIIRLFFKIFTQPELQTTLEAELGWDGLIVLVVGSLSAVYVTIQQVIKLF